MTAHISVGKELIHKKGDFVLKSLPLSGGDRCIFGPKVIQSSSSPTPIWQRIPGQFLQSSLAYRLNPGPSVTVTPGPEELNW